MIEFRRATHRVTSPIETAHGTIHERRVLFVGIESDGLVGWTEVAPLPGFSLPLDLDDIEVQVRTATDGGSVTDLAASVIDAARNDLSARTSNIALAEYLAGHQVPTKVAVNATVSSTEPGAVGAACQSAIRSGFSAVKLKVGFGSVDADVRRVEAARSAIGSTTELRLDANQGFTFDEADQFLRSLEPFDISLVEEPTANPHDIAKLAGRGVPLALDETLGTAAAADQWIDSEGLAAVVLKPAVCGGPMATMQLAMAARSRGLRVIVTSFFDGPVGLAAAAHVAAACGEAGPHGLATAGAIDFPASLIPVNGTIELPPGPGLGVVPHTSSGVSS